MHKPDGRMTAQTTKPQPKVRRVTPDHKQQIAKLATKGNTEREISQLTNLPKTTVHHELRKLRTDPKYLDFKENKADVLETLQYQIVSAVDQTAIKSMVNKRGTVDIAILEDKIRTIRGQATDISDVQLRGLILHFQGGKSVHNPVDK
jgi:hypothetical protein